MNNILGIVFIWFPCSVIYGLGIWVTNTKLFCHFPSPKKDIIECTLGFSAFIGFFCAIILLTIIFK